MPFLIAFFFYVKIVFIIHLIKISIRVYYCIVLFQKYYCPVTYYLLIFIIRMILFYCIHCYCFLPERVNKLWYGLPG